MYHSAMYCDTMLHVLLCDKVEDKVEGTLVEESPVSPPGMRSGGPRHQGSVRPYIKPCRGDSRGVLRTDASDS